MLGNMRLQAELAHIHMALSRVAAGERGKNLIDDLHGATGGTTAATLWQSLYADCLRVVYEAVAAGGPIADDKVNALYDFLCSVARYFGNVPLSPYSDLVVTDRDSAREVLHRYAEDAGPFGLRTEGRWPGRGLCRAAAELGEPEALERYKRMMAWLIPAARQIGGVTEAELRRRGRVDELADLRRDLADDGEVAPATADRRVPAFLTPAQVFACMEQATSVFEADPFDVETIHADTRATFERMVTQAISTSQPARGSQMLLVLGDSGAGKTHLLRGFRRHVQEFGRGFVAYAQLPSSSEDYPQYLLRNVVHSLSLPYAGPAGERTGLYELASGLSWRVGESLRSRLARLDKGTWAGPGNLTDYVNSLVDEILKREDLASFDPDLLRVMIFALRRDPPTTSRVYKYLRCEDMNAHDRSWIGDVVPRTGKDDPSWMLGQLARLAFATRRAAFVLMIDQVELAGYDGNTGPMFRRAIDALYRIVDEERSVIVVVACLSDLYSQVRGQLIRSAIDRLEKDPPIKRLQINRSYAEIEAIVARRLSWLFAREGAAHLPEQPVHPIPKAQLESLTNRRTRDVLEWCHEFQERCAVAGKIIEDGQGVRTVPPGPPTGVVELDQIAAAWKDAMRDSRIEVPEKDAEILGVITAAAKAYAEETGLELAASPSKDGVRVQISGQDQRLELALAVTNRGYQGGAFGAQLEALRKAAGNARPIAVRTIEIPRGGASEKALSRLSKDDGRCVYIDKPTLQSMVASQRFQPGFPADRITAWRRRDRPLSSLRAVTELFGLEPPQGLIQAPPEPPPTSASTRTKPKAPRSSAAGSRTSK